jgi:hypothetical protein
MKSKVLLILLGVFFVSNMEASEWSLKPVLNPTLEYDDNVFLRSTNKENDFKLSAKPSLELSYAEEDKDLTFTGGYSIARYDQLSRLDEDNPFFSLKATKRTEVSTWGIELGYRETASRNTALENTGDFSSTSVVTTQNISPSYQYSISERDSLGLNFSYSQREYSTNEFNDNENTSISGSWQHQFTERLSSSFNVYYAVYESGTSFTGFKSDTFNLSLGASYLLSESWSIQGQVGARQLDSDRLNEGIKSTSSTRGSSFNVSVNYNDDLNTFHLSGAQSLNPSSSGDVNEQLSFSVSWGRSLSETTNFNLGISYRENVSASEINSNKRENISFKTSIIKSISERASMNFNYEFREQKITSEDAASGNAVSVTFNYKFDVYQVSR